MFLLRVSLFELSSEGRELVSLLLCGSFVKGYVVYKKQVSVFIVYMCSGSYHTLSLGSRKWVSKPRHKLSFWFPMTQASTLCSVLGGILGDTQARTPWICVFLMLVTDSLLCNLSNTCEHSQRTASYLGDEIRVNCDLICREQCKHCVARVHHCSWWEEVLSPSWTK